MKAFDATDLKTFLSDGVKLAPPPQQPDARQVTVCVDTLVEGVHFPEDVPVTDIAYKALAVNLSDMAAMGSEPYGYILGLVLPHWDEQWLAGFRQGLQDLCRQHQLCLFAVDVRQGPLSITIQVEGYVETGCALRRDHARAGDLIYVSGTLGDAACALTYWQKGESLPAAQRTFLEQRWHRPAPRLQLGLALTGLAHAAIDISDGLAADLGHILEESHIGARVNIDCLPRSSALSGLTAEQLLHLQLFGGDDYELCFTAPQSSRDELHRVASEQGIQLTQIGEIIDEPGLHWFRGEQAVNINGQAYDHFAVGSGGHV